MLRLEMWLGMVCPWHRAMVCTDVVLVLAVCGMQASLCFGRPPPQEFG